MSPNNQLSQNWVLIRGLIRSRYHWLDFPEKLQKRFNAASVELVEIAGNGFLHNEKSPSDIAEAVELLRKQVKSNEPFNLVGISLGGMLATQWAQLYPDEVANLVLINTSSKLSPFYKRMFPRHYFQVIKNFVIDNPRASEDFIMGATSNHKEIWQPLIPQLSQFQNEHPIKFSNFLNQLWLTAQADFNEIPCMPKLILASRGDRLVNSDCSTAIAKKWNCPLRIHPHAGHDLPLDDSTWVLDQIGSNYV
jgi:pimeloyl-ACP methyl ester carboxylesterase